jgi:hypothetical protein
MPAVPSAMSRCMELAHFFGAILSDLMAATWPGVAGGWQEFAVAADLSGLGSATHTRAA